MARTTMMLTIAFVLAACGSGSSGGGNEGQADSGGGGDESYVFLPKSLNNPYWADAREGMNAAAEDLGVQAEFIGPDTPDAAQQLQLFESAISRNPNGIAVSPINAETIASAISRATAQGIPVIAWDGPAPDSEAVAYVGTDNVAAGEKLAEAVASNLNEEGQVAVLAGNLTAINARERLEGFEQGLEQYPNIEIVTQETTGESVEGATSTAENLLQAQPELDALVGITGADAPGAGLAVQGANRCDEVQVAGFDVVEQGVELMRNGCVQALVSQKPYGMTVQALELLNKLDEGGEAEQEAYDTGTILVTPESLEQFLEEAPH
ncbi:MAG: sugar-binding protein [Rubrobacteraceae bacterium]